MDGIDPDKLPAGIRTGIEFELPGEDTGREVEVEFLAEFAAGTGVVVFAGVEVAGGAGVVAEWEGVFGGGTFLDEEFVPAVDEEDVDGAVAKFLSVNFGASGLADHAVVFVNDVEDLGRVLHGDGVAGMRGKEKPPDCSGGFPD